MKRILLLAVATLAVATLAACSGEEDANRVVGELMSDRIELTAEFSEPIVAIEFAEGDAVTAGQLLVQQNDARARSRLAEADGALGQAQARLNELVRGPRQEQIRAARANLEGANQDLAFRRTEEKRLDELSSQGLASIDLHDRTVAQLDAAIANQKLRQAQLQELLSGTTVEELAQAEQTVKQAEARRDAAQVDVDRHAIRAAVDGVADSRLFELGERPGVGQPVAVMLGGEQPYARVYIPEPLRVRVAPGTDALLWVDGLEQPVKGTVRWVATEAAFTPYFALTERDRGRLAYVAKVDVAEQRDRLPDGVPVEVELLLD